MRKMVLAPTMPGRQRPHVAPHAASIGWPQLGQKISCGGTAAAIARDKRGASSTGAAARVRGLALALLFAEAFTPAADRAGSRVPSLDDFDILDCGRVDPARDEGPRGRGEGASTSS